MASVQNKKLRLLLLWKENVISTKFMHLLDFSHITLILCITSSTTSRDDDCTERIRRAVRCKCSTSRWQFHSHAKSARRHLSFGELCYSESTKDILVIGNCFQTIFIILVWVLVWVLSALLLPTSI